MAQIKVLKIDANGWQHEHESADDVTFATVTGATQIGVTSGVTITSNIAFNAVTDTIAGIQNQNLLDKSASETISADWTIATGYNLTLTDAPTATTDAANKAYVDSVATGLDWQDSVKDKDLTAPPGSPSTGDRYIVAATATGAWAGQENNIAEWNGTSWDFTTVSEGMATWVEDEDVVYVYNGTGWVKMSSVYNHNDLTGLQGGTTNEYYHLTATEDAWVTAGLGVVTDGADLVGKDNNVAITGNWTYTGRNDFNGGELSLPNAASATPAEGDTYWDGTADILYVYNGTAWVNVSSAGTASSVQTTYTAGTGGIAQYDVVYISSADTVLKADASAIATAKVIGMAPSAIVATSSGVIQEDGVVTGCLTGATAGTPYFLSTTAGLVATTRPTGSGEVVYKIGYAKNATDLHLQIEFVGIRS